MGLISFRRLAGRRAVRSAQPVSLRRAAFIAVECLEDRTHFFVGPTHFSVTAPPVVNKGSSFSFTVTALDSTNAVFPSYTATVGFSSSDIAAALPPNYPFVAGDNGVRVFSATLNTAGSQTITATDTVSSALTGTSNTILVNNVPSGVSGTLESGFISENDTAKLSGSFTDADSGDTHTVDIDWGDGSTHTSIPLAAGVTTFSDATHVYADDGASPGNGTSADFYTITILVTDSNSASGNTTKSITVNNVKPSNLAVTSPASVSEGFEFNISGTFDDPGSLDVHTVTIDWGDTNVDTFPLTAGTTSFLASHTYDDDNPGNGPADINTIAVTVDDDDIGSTFVNVPILVKNVAPRAELAGDLTGVPGQQRELIGIASDISMADQGAKFKYTFNFGDGSPALVTSSYDPAVVNHTFSKTGTFKMTLKVTDKDTGTSTTVSQNMVIKSVDLQPDPCNDVLTALVVGGGTGADTIEITPNSSGFRVKINGATKGTFFPDGKILVYGNDGDDTITVNTAITRDAWIFGGRGKDTLRGGNGNDFIDGGLGNDKLFGNGARDVLVGGGDTDQIDGGSDNDILIAGLLDYTNPVPDLESICAIMDEWTRQDLLFSARVSNLQTGDGLNGSVVLTANTVTSSPLAPDKLTGGLGADLFFINPTTQAGKKDTITDLTSSDQRIFV